MALINGISYDWESITVVLFGVPVIGITKIDYNTKQNKSNNYGFGTKPVSRGYGNKEFTGSIELYTEEWVKICQASATGDPLDIPWFNITVIFANKSGKVVTDTLQACEFLENPLTANQGDTSLKVNIPLIIGDITRFQ